VGMPRHVAFASERLTSEPWAAIPDGTLIRAINRAAPPIRLAACPVLPDRVWVH
jgi:hypothetical protein